MKHEDLPPRWKDRVKKWLAARGEPGRTKLSAGDFPADVTMKIRFEDGSHAQFRYPVVIEAPEWNEVGVFTEHCGYHLFPAGSIYGLEETGRH